MCYDVSLYVQKKIKNLVIPLSSVRDLIEDDTLSIDNEAIWSNFDVFIRGEIVDENVKVETLELMGDLYSYMAFRRALEESRGEITFIIIWDVGIANQITVKNGEIEEIPYNFPLMEE